MESSPAVAGDTIQYTAMDYCKGRAEKGRVSHRLLPAHLQLSHSLTGQTPNATVPDNGGLSTSKDFPKPLSDSPHDPN